MKKPMTKHSEEPKKTNWLLVVLIIAIWAFFVVKTFKSGDNISNTSSLDTAKPTVLNEQETEPEVMKVSIKTMLDDYKANELRADEKYKNKYIEVSWPVTEITTVFGEGLVVIWWDSYFSDVSCYLTDTEKSKAWLLNKGDIISVYWKCNWYVMGIAIAIYDCKIR